MRAAFEPPSQIYRISVTRQGVLNLLPLEGNEPVIQNRTRGVVIAGLRGSSGKTVLSVGLAREWSRKGLRVAPFKKGPDYIDAHWLSLAAGRESRNLDVLLCGGENVRRYFLDGVRGSDIAIIEGNRGIFDGLDECGTYSTAELSGLLKTPIVLIVDCAKTTRTAAAMIAGCKALDPGLRLRGVVLNNVANSRHEKILKNCIESETGVKVVGAFPKLSNFPFPERHLGLLMPLEHDAAMEAANAAADLVVEHIDLDVLWRISEEVEPIESVSAVNGDSRSGSETVKIGIIRDDAFTFYYPANIDELKRNGARLIEINSIGDRSMPEVDALYIGGGFPETLAERLSKNESFRKSLRDAAKRGLPIYAECGGAMYLGETIKYNGVEYPMAGALPITYELRKKPQGHGYTELEVDRENPFFEIGKKIKGHEFHYSRVLTWNKDELTTVMKNQRGCGFEAARDGVCKDNILALYSHSFDLYGASGWARALTDAARRYGAMEDSAAEKKIRPASINKKLRNVVQIDNVI